MVPDPVPGDRLDISTNTSGRQAFCCHAFAGYCSLRMSSQSYICTAVRMTNTTHSLATFCDPRVGVVSCVPVCSFLFSSSSLLLTPCIPCISATHSCLVYFWILPGPSPVKNTLWHAANAIPTYLDSRSETPEHKEEKGVGKQSKKRAQRRCGNAVCIHAQRQAMVLSGALG